MENPNKSDLIQTVTACELKESCYRIPFIEYYYEIVHHADGVKEEKLKVGGDSALVAKTFFLYPSPFKYSKLPEWLKLASAVSTAYLTLEEFGMQVSHCLLYSSREEMRSGRVPDGNEASFIRQMLAWNTALN